MVLMDAQLEEWEANDRRVRRNYIVGLLGVYAAVVGIVLFGRPGISAQTGAVLLLLSHVLAVSAVLQLLRRRATAAARAATYRTTLERDLIAGNPRPAWRVLAPESLGEVVLRRTFDGLTAILWFLGAIVTVVAAENFSAPGAREAVASVIGFAVVSSLASLLVHRARPRLRQEIERPYQGEFP